MGKPLNHRIEDMFYAKRKKVKQHNIKKKEEEGVGMNTESIETTFNDHTLWANTTTEPFTRRRIRCTYG